MAPLSTLKLDKTRLKRRKEIIKTKKGYTNWREIKFEHPQNKK